MLMLMQCKSNYASLTPRVLQGVPKMISMLVVRSALTMHLSCAEINTISKWIKTSFLLTNISLEYHRVCPK